MADETRTSQRAPTASHADEPGRWPPAVREILGGDLVVALGYRTPAAGTVVPPITTMGMADEASGTVTFTSSFGTPSKLRRIDEDGRVALHAREHGGADGAAYVLVQGDASFPERPDPAFLERLHRERWSDFAPPRRRGRIWDRLTREYHDLRVPVTVEIRRISVWPDPPASGDPETTIGAPWPSDPPPAQEAPAKGTGPRVRARRYRRRLERSRHTLVGWCDVEGYPVVRPAEVAREGDHLVLSAPAPLPPQRRAGVLAHWFDDHMVGQGSAVLTGWLDDEGRYAPHTVAGYAMPMRSRTMYELASSLSMKFGYRKAVKEGLVTDGVWQRRR